MILDPLSTLLWYSIVIFALCGALAWLADRLEKASERRARWEQREALRVVRRQPGPGAGEAQGRSYISDAEPSFSLRSWHQP